MRRVLVSLLALAIGVPGAVYALGLGRLQQNSGLNEPFRGRIELLGADPEGVDDLKVDLADNAQFDRAGIPRPLELNKLAFEVVVDPDGRAYVQLTSRDPIREPYLNFLLELNWPQGRLVREYTALLDPPTYDPSARKAAAPAPAPAPAAAPAPVPEAAPADAPAAEAPAAAAPAVAGDGTIGRATGPSDTLWSIASASRPDESVSVQQMMLALLRANPEAFASDNINGLKQGYVLRIPDVADINALSRAEALDEVKRQHALWEELRGSIAAATPPEPVAATPEPAPAPAAEAPAPEAPAAAPETPAEPAAEPVPAGDAAVKIVSAGEGAGAAETLAPADLEKMSLDELRAQLAIAQESLTAQGAENSDLKSQVGESQELVERLQRLVTLREQELAQLQQAIAERSEQPAGEPAAEPAPADTGAADVFEEPAAEAPAPAPAPVPAPAPAPAAKPAPAPAPVAAEPPAAPVGMLDGLVGSVVPKYIVDLVPGGALTLLAVPVVGLLIAIAVVVLRRGGSGERAPSSRAAAAAAAADDEDATVAAGIDSEDVTETPTDSRGDDSAAETEAPTVFQAPAPAATPAEDPLQELNIYLAYEQFDKAEELVRNAIRNEPDNLGYKVRLLEVYYSASNKRDYEATARDVYEATGGSGPDWNTTVAMWQELSPDRALFAAGGEAEAETPLEATAAARQFVDITADAGEEVGADTVSFMPTGEATQPGPARAGAEPDAGGLDFDLGDTGTEESGTLDVTGGATDAQDMFDVSAGGPVVQNEADDDILDLTAAAGADAGDQVFDLTQGADEPPAIEFDIGGEADDDILDVTAGGGAGTDILDLTGGGAPTPGEDLLDVTVTGDLGSIDQTELLNVTSPGTLSLDVGDEPAAADGADDGGAEVLDITATAGGDEGGLIDFDFSGADTLTALPGEGAPVQEASPAPADDDLEFDISGLTVEAEEPPATHAGDAGGGLEIDLSGEDFGLDDGGDTLDLPDAPANSSELEGLSITMGDADDLSLDTSGLSLELDDGNGGDGAETLRMDLPADLSLDIGGDEDQTLVLPRAPGAEEPSDMDDAEQALSLATSYMEMGGGFEADVRENLQKVLAIGTPQQREEAQRLLDQL